MSFFLRCPSVTSIGSSFSDTRAVEPLERTAQWEAAEPPETYPFAV
jgi:hypothetical protein